MLEVKYKGVYSSVVKWLLSMHKGPEFNPQKETEKEEERREVYMGRWNSKTSNLFISKTRRKPPL